MVFRQPQLARDLRAWLLAFQYDFTA